MQKVTNSIYYVGVNDHQVDLFEGQFDVPLGMAYNSYLISDDMVAIFDTVDVHFFDEWMKNIKEVLGDRKPNFLVVQHMEPDHSANIMRFLSVYPDTTVIGNAKTFKMMDQFFHAEIPNKWEVKDGDVMSTGHHDFTFVFAPMVHWPEVMVTYDSVDKVLFSADGFGKFGANDVEDPEGWDCEARRYYFGIVGKYGPQVQILLKKASALDIRIICPLHGPVLTENLGHYIKQYDTWSSYRAETDGVAIFYTSVYGHTKEAAELLFEQVKSLNCPKATLVDLAREDIHESIEDAFRYSKIVLATTTYNSGIFPKMNEFIEHLLERNYQNKVIGLIENGTWAPTAARLMKAKFEKSKNINFVEPVVTIVSSMTEENKEQIKALADVLCEEYVANHAIEVETKPVFDNKSLNKIGYGLYVVTCKDGSGKDNGLIVNTVTQIASEPRKIAVSISKLNYSHNLIKQYKEMNINVLSIDAPFAIFERFGFHSGRDTDKFKDFEVIRSSNGLAVLPQYINAYLTLKVTDYVDLGSHGMFICDVEEGKAISNVESMSYNYYHANVKPKPENKAKQGYVCKICGWVYEGENLPEDIVCPLCKHGASDFEKIK